MEAGSGEDARNFGHGRPDQPTSGLEEQACHSAIGTRGQRPVLETKFCSGAGKA
jgi:hypothetical protein